MNKKILLFLIPLIVIIILCSGCMSNATVQNKALVGKWTSGDLTVEMFDNGKGYLKYQSVSTDFTYKVLSNNTVEITNTLIGTHQFTYNIENPDSILIEYQGSTYRLEKVS